MERQGVIDKLNYNSVGKTKNGPKDKLDIMRQAETHLIQRHYDGFLRKGKIRGRFDRRSGGGKTASKNTMVWLYTLIAIMVIVGVTYMIAKDK